MKVVSIKSRYMNIRGHKKVKLLTKGKYYDVVKDFSNVKMYGIIDDEGIFVSYNKSNFIKISEIRDQKLETLGI